MSDQQPIMGNSWKLDDEEVEKVFRRMWTENGDKLSNQYTNTNSNIKGVIESGKQGFTGKLALMFIGAQRYIANNFTD